MAESVCFCMFDRRVSRAGQMFRYNSTQRCSREHILDMLCGRDLDCPLSCPETLSRPPSRSAPGRRLGSCWRQRWKTDTDYYQAFSGCRCLRGRGMSSDQARLRRPRCGQLMYSPPRAVVLDLLHS